MPSAYNIRPAVASPTGNPRGNCDWADRPLTFNSVGDTLNVADQAFAEFVWNGTAWVTSAAPVAPLLPGPYTVATLPAAGIAGRRTFVTNALTPTFLGAAVGGGAVVCPVFDNGTTWITV